MLFRILSQPAQRYEDKSAKPSQFICEGFAVGASSAQALCGVALKITSKYGRIVKVWQPHYYLRYKEVINNEK